MVGPSRVIAAALLGALTFAASPSAHASTSVAVMALRVQPGTVSTGVFQEANNLVWQRVLTIPGIQPVSESQIAAQVGPGTYGTIRQCAQDSCMAQVAQLTGAQRVLWGWIRATPAGGFVTEIRVVDPFGRVHGRSAPGCEPCAESGVLAALATWDPISLGLAGGQPARATQPPTPPVRTAPAPPLSQRAPMPPPVAAGPKPGKLRLKTEPIGAQAWINGQSFGVTPLRDIELNAGTYQIGLRAEGHQDQMIPVVVQAGKTVSEKVVMVPTTGTLTIKTKPKGATVAVDGRTLGTSPIKKVRLPLGEHVVDVWLDGFSPVRESITVAPRKPAKLKLKLVSTRGLLYVTSKPSGASVRIDGNFVGVTPIKKHRLDAGEHELITFLSGFDEATQKVQIVGGAAAKVKVRLSKQSPTDGRVLVSSKPAGARVMIANQEVGVTPVDIDYRKGHYVLRWILDGYEPVEQKVEVKGGRRNKFHVKLQRALPAPGYGELTVLPKPDDAEVLVEGTSYGTTGLKDRLMLAGRYTVTLKREGYHEMTFAVQLPSRKRVVVKKKLKKLPPPPPDGTLSVVTDPPGAKVTVNDFEIGKSPVSGYKLRPGWYKLQVTMEGHEPHEEQFEAKPKKGKSVDVRLPSHFAALKLDSNPPGATVFLGGQELGVTPGEWRMIKPGNYDVVVSKVGQKEKVLHLSLKRDTVTTRMVGLGKAGAFLTLRSKPPGAAVYIDGAEVGVTPLSRHELPPGPHKLSLVLDGYEEIAGDIELSSKENKQLRFPLRKLPEPVRAPEETPEEPAATEPPPPAAETPPPAQTPPQPETPADQPPQAAAPPPPPAAATPPPRTLSAPSGAVGGMAPKQHKRLAPGEAVGIPNSGAPADGPPPGAPPAVDGQIDPSAPPDHQEAG